MAGFGSGWNMPPGCYRTPADEPDPPCEVCGRDIDDCICPECPVCTEQGDPHCYHEHGLVRSAFQIASRREAEERWAADDPWKDWPSNPDPEDY